MKNQKQQIYENVHRKSVRKGKNRPTGTQEDEKKDQLYSEDSERTNTKEEFDKALNKLKNKNTR